MSTGTDASQARERITIYITIAVIFVALVVVAVLSHAAANTTAQAEQKADQLTAELQAAGLPVPSHEQIVRVLGDDGGAACAHPNEALTRATLAAQLANGSGGPGTRPIITDSRLLQGQLLVIKTYCPDELADFQQFVDDLKTARVAER